MPTDHAKRSFVRRFSLERARTDRFLGCPSRPLTLPLRNRFADSKLDSVSGVLLLQQLKN